LAWHQNCWYLTKSSKKVIIFSGEEEEVNEDFAFDFNSLKRDGIPKDLLAGATSTEIDLSKAIVWIDPLDGTVEFIRGN